MVVLWDSNTMCLCKKDLKVGKKDYRACALIGCSNTNHKDAKDGGTGIPVKVILCRLSVDKQGTLAIMVSPSSYGQKALTLFSRPLFHLIKLPPGYINS